MVRSQKYDTDFTDGQWSVLRPFIPQPKTGGRPRTTNERSVINGILYLVKTGCQWQSLPTDFPPWETVYRYYAAWRRKGVWKRIHRALFERARKADHKAPQPSAIVVDSQSVKSGKMVSTRTRGFDGGKRVKGRKRHMVVDTQGLLMEVSVTPANVHDTKGAQYALGRVARNQKKKTIKTVFVDKGYQGPNFAGWVKHHLHAEVQVGNNLTKAGQPFIPAKTRWVVERSFAWLGDYYRLSIGRERKPRNSATLVRLALIRVILRRLWPG